MWKVAFIVCVYLCECRKWCFICVAGVVSVDSSVSGVSCSNDLSVAV